MKTTSILESIRNKMKKIEDNDATPENSDELHDDFEYIDDTSKDLIDSKHTAITNHATGGKSNISGSGDDDFDFLSEDSEEKHKSDKTTATPPSKPAQNYDSKNDDIDLSDLDLDLKDKPVSKKNPEPKKPTLDDLGLDDIDVDADLKVEDKAPKAKENHSNDLDGDLTDDLTGDLADDLADDLDLEKIFEEEMPEVKTAETPKISETPKMAEMPEKEEKNPTAAGNLSGNIPSMTSQDDDIFRDEDLEISENEQPVQLQNNYQESDKTNMENPNKSAIISEEIAKQTSSTIKDIIKSVPKTAQNQQVLSSSSPAFKSGETIEEMVAAMLSPKLEQWINENLPPMVERIVKKEIKRLLPDEHE